MTIRYCPNCFKNVVTVPLKPNCTECGRKHTLPVDNSLPVPRDTSKHDKFVDRREYRDE